MGMPACQDLTGIGSEKLLKFLLRCSRQNDVIKGCGGAVKAQQVRSIFKLDGDRRLKFGDKINLICRELGEGPESNFSHLPQSFGRNSLIGCFFPADQPGVGISHHHRAIHPT